MIAVKSAVDSANPYSFVQLNRAVDSFLLQCRNVNHGTTGESHAQSFNSRCLRFSSLALLEAVNFDFIVE